MSTANIPHQPSPKNLFFHPAKKQFMAGFPLYKSFNLDDDRFRLDLTSTSIPWSNYKLVLQKGPDVLKSNIYEEENFKALALIAFFSRFQVEKLLITATGGIALRPGAVGLLAVLGLDEHNTLCLILGPADEVGRMIPASDSFDKQAVWKWDLGTAGAAGIPIGMSDFLHLRDNFMELIAPDPLRYKGFKKIIDLQSDDIKISIDGNFLFKAIFDISTDLRPSPPAPQPPISPAISVTFQLIIREDDDHPNLPSTPAKYLSIGAEVAAHNATPHSAYLGRATPLYTVYNTHPK